MFLEPPYILASALKINNRSNQQYDNTEISILLR